MTLAWLRLTQKTFNLDGGAGGAGGAADGGAQNPFGGAQQKQDAPAAGGQGQQQQPGQQGADGQPYFPDKFPDHLRGGSDKETIDKLYGAFSGMRNDMAQRGAVPKDSNGYEIKVSDDLQKVLGDLSKDRGVGIYKNLALKHGLTDKQAAGFFQDYHAEALSAGLIKTIDVQAEAKKLVGENAGKLSGDELMAEAGKRWQTNMDWVDGLERSKVLSPEQSKAVKALGETADGLLAIEAFSKLSREHGIQGGGKPQGGGQITKADLDARVADPRNQPFSGKFDPVFEQQTREMFKSLYGGK